MNLPDVLYRYAEKRPPKIINRISPSMLGRCMRAHWYAIHQVPQTTPPNPGAILNFQVGFLWEDVVRDAFRSQGIPFIEQYTLVDEELNVAGTLDFAVYNPEENTWTVIDSKTESVYATDYRKREGKSFFQKHPEYVIQLTTYALLLERQGFNVPEGRFLVITKDNGLLEESVAVFSEELKEMVMERIKTMNGYLERNELPPCGCEGWLVGYCNYGDPTTQAPNKKGKVINTSCCSADLMEEK